MRDYEAEARAAELRGEAKAAKVLDQETQAAELKAQAARLRGEEEAARLRAQALEDEAARLRGEPTRSEKLLQDSAAYHRRYPRPEWDDNGDMYGQGRI